MEVRWGDMDALGHVNNAAYFVYFEQIRTSLFGDIHCTDEDGITPIHMILAETRCRYRIPAKFPDTLTMGARNELVDESRGEFIQHYAALSETSGTVVAEGMA